MRSRAFNKRVEIWSTVIKADDFGGNTTVAFLVTSSWAKIETFKSGNKNNTDTDFGTLSTDNGIIITLRKRNDFEYNSTTHFLKYRGEKYIISTNPTNKDFKDGIIQFICVREQEDNIELSELEIEASIAPSYKIRVEADGGVVESLECVTV